MKIFLSSSAFILLIMLSTMQGGLTSCTKDNTIYDTVTVIKKDTVVVKDTVYIEDTIVTEALLTANPWKIRELRGLTEGTPGYYLRGGNANTVNFDNEYYVFESNHTGYEMGHAGGKFTLPVWQLDVEKAKLTFTYPAGSGLTMEITWDELRYKDGALYYNEWYYNPASNKDNHGQFIRIPQ